MRDAPVCPRRASAQLSELAGIAISIAAYCLPVSHFNALAIGIRATEADGAEAIVVANAAAAFAVACTGLAGPEAGRLRVCRALIRQPKAGQRHAGESDTEFFQRCAARDRLGQALGEFIEFIVHTFPFVLVCRLICFDRAEHGSKVHFFPGEKQDRAAEREADAFE